MALDNSASITDMANEIGADPSRLTDAAKQLNKGQLLEMWGAADHGAALTSFQGGSSPSQTLHLTSDDIASIQAVFTPDAASSATADSIGGVSLGDIKCCCCPCCCAAISLEDPRRL